MTSIPFKLCQLLWIFWAFVRCRALSCFSCMRTGIVNGDGAIRPPCINVLPPANGPA
jgi:hypothetical protein